MSSLAQATHAETAGQKRAPQPQAPSRQTTAPEAFSGAPPVQRKPACACGGGCPRCQAAASAPGVGGPGTPRGQEAGRAADRPTRSPTPEGRRPGSASRDEATPAPSEEEGGGLLAKTLQAPGSPLDAPTRAAMERRFGHDFSQVRIHAGGLDAEAARAAGARALNVGNRIVFGAGQYAPETPRGRWLLAHELAHVAQAKAGGGSSTAAHLERDASDAATAALRGEAPILRARHDGTQIHLFGEPENVPETTYISTQGGAGFLQEAAAFHRAWGLPIQQVDSVEQMLNHLAGGNAPVGRIRFVTHSADIGVFTSLFRGEPLESLTQERVSAYAESDAAGLALDTHMSLNVNIGPITDEIRAAPRTAALLTPFGLETSGQPPGQLETFFQRVLQLMMLRQGRTAANAARFDPLIQALPTVLRHVASLAAAEFPGPPPATPQNVLDLQPAIEGAATSLRIRFRGVSVPAAQAAHVREALRATGAGFRQTLNTVRQRFTGDSWIDIRGCNAGDSIDYLRAVARFFGRAPNLPHVSAPNWFQIFPILRLRPLSSVAQINAAGARPRVAEAIDRWSPLTGARQQMEMLRSFYSMEITRREQLAAQAEAASAQAPNIRLDASGLPRINPLLAGMPTTAEDRSAVDLLLMPALPRPQLQEPRLFTPPLPQVSLGNRRLRDPAIAMARAALDRLNAPNAELRYYLDSALVLPVFRGGNQQSFELLVKRQLMDEAIDGWLASQWSSAAPGLAALQAGPADATNARRVQALVETRQRNAAPGAQMVFPPDPRFWEHIRHI